MTWAASVCPLSCAEHTKTGQGSAVAFRTRTYPYRVSAAPGETTSTYVARCTRPDAHKSPSTFGADPHVLPPSHLLRNRPHGRRRRRRPGLRRTTGHRGADGDNHRRAAGHHVRNLGHDHLDVLG